MKIVEGPSSFYSKYTMARCQNQQSLEIGRVCGWMPDEIEAVVDNPVSIRE
ncbi:MAG: hypothetical protein MJA29_02020 [Candidatus Omnitrophica bacterium]|nr:hypothetical protein [Candidatus Omnitrophota bacterium]